MDPGAFGAAAPWLQPFEGLGPEVRAAWQGGTPLPDALNRMPGAAVRFVPHSALPADVAYEQFIFDTGTVPTRDNLHDCFNGLVWLRYPQAKRRLNALQALAIADTGVGAVRGPLRDAITLFDENGAMLFAPAPLREALAARDWRRLFVDLRPLWQQAQLVLFGHALLEKLESPRKPITAHVYQAQHAIDSVADVDAWLAGALDPSHLATKPFLPLPVLGVPGWWPENENFCFYDDSLVFRSARPA
ncbi:DUF3025 domain-containing protein [Acidovorax sp. SUPP3334]|nr:DUF3025 domain-containing protein [Acidovorax sp. SUPP3334]